jgi:TIR domain
MSTESRLFISHAVADAAVVKPFVQLLESGVGVPPKDIFCASIKGQSIRPGKDFKSSIHENLNDATTVLALISDNYYNSAFSMCELGGCWLQAKDWIPILIPPIKYADMKAVLVGIQATRIDSTEDLDELRDELGARLGVPLLPTPRWTEKRTDFLAKLPDYLKSLAPSPSVPRALLDKAQTVIREYEQSTKQSDEEKEQLRRTITELKKLKDVAAVAAIERRELPAAQQFEKLTDEVRKKLAAVSSVAREAIFAGNLGDDYYPGKGSSPHSWEDTDRPIQYKEVKLNAAGNGVEADGNNPKVKPALAAIDKLETWLQREAPESFFDWYVGANGGYQPDLKDRAFWDRHLW